MKSTPTAWSQEAVTAAAGTAATAATTATRKAAKRPQPLEPMQHEQPAAAAARSRFRRRWFVQRPVDAHDAPFCPGQDNDAQEKKGRGPHLTKKRREKLQETSRWHKDEQMICRTGPVRAARSRGMTSRGNETKRQVLRSCVPPKRTSKNVVVLKS